MFEPGSAIALAAELREGRDQLTVVRHRVIAAAQSVPGSSQHGWVGPAGEAYHRSLELLRREVSAAAELLRSASDLTTAALFELGQRD